MMRLFSRSSSTPKEEPSKIENIDNEKDPIAKLNSIQANADRAMDKIIKSIDYFSYYEKGNEQGNYFGLEFDIQASAMRIKAAFSREPWMWASAQLIARTMVTIPYKVKARSNNQELPKHPLNAFLKAANPLQDDLTIDWCRYLDLVLGGNSFLIFDEKFKSAMQVPVESVQLKEPGDNMLIDGVRVINPVTGQQKEVSYEQIIHSKFPNPYSPFYGISLFIAASRPILLDRFKNEYEMAFYLRGATNSGVIETTEDLGKTRLERLLRTFEAAYTSKRNWWRTVFLPKGAKWVGSGLTMTEMQHLEGLKENRLTLLATLGIPPSKVGIVQDVNRATSEDQDKTFYENTIVPLSLFEAAGWNNSYIVKKIYSDKVYVEPDFSQIACLQESLKQKGEKAKAVESVWTIDEQREKIFSMPKIGDERGNKLVAEIRSAGLPTAGLVPDGNNPSEPPKEPPKEPEKTKEIATIEPKNFKIICAVNKDNALEGQEKIEARFTKEFNEGYNKYIEELFKFVEAALRSNRDVHGFLVAYQKELEKVYITSVGIPLVRAMERAFSLANTQAKSLSPEYLKQIKAQEITDVDQQAIDVLRETTADGRKQTLINRVLDNFVGFNRTRSTEIIDMIANYLEQGITLDKIAENIRHDYGEAYPSQSNTVARTEVLSAISEGLKWNHDVLKEVFSEVEKQWLHVGDVGSNPDARAKHYEFQLLGPMPSNYRYGGSMEYPRDPNGGADEVINCRCSMVSVIPDTAHSNAEIILNRY